MKEKTHSTTASEVISSCCSSKLPGKIPYPALQVPHIFRILMHPVWTQNTRYRAQYDNEMLVKISPLKFSSSQIPCMQIHPQVQGICSSHENLWCWSFSSARKHSEPKRTLLPPAESCVHSLLSSQITTLLDTLLL